MPHGRRTVGGIFKIAVIPPERWFQTRAQSS